jgi:hypothetical protein
MRTAPLAALALLTLALSSTAAAGPPDPDVKRMLDGAKQSYKINENGDFVIEVRFSDDAGRTQLVYIRSVVETQAKHRIREIWSAGYRAPADEFSAPIANHLLESSHAMKLGSWEKHDRFAVFVVKIDAGANVDDLGTAVSYAAAKADDMEKELTKGGDEF